MNYRRISATGDDDETRLATALNQGTVATRRLCSNRQRLQQRKREKDDLPTARGSNRISKGIHRHHHE